MTYIEPFLGGGGVILNKDKSSEEVLNDSDEGLVSAWRALRDEHKTLTMKLRKTEHTEATFLRHRNKQVSGDYMNAAVSEFVLRHMSRGANKTSYAPHKSDEHFLDSFLPRFKDVHERLEGVYILNKDALSILRAFSHENTLAYCDPPSVEEMSAEKHMELSDALKEFKGKVIITFKNSAMYRRLYSDWNRKGIPGRSKESAWFNF